MTESYTQIKKRVVERMQAMCKGRVATRFDVPAKEYDALEAAYLRDAYPGMEEAVKKARVQDEVLQGEIEELQRQEREIRNTINEKYKLKDEAKKVIRARDAKPTECVFKLLEEVNKTGVLK